MRVKVHKCTFVYRSLQSISGFSVGTLRHVNGLFFSSGIVFSTADVDFVPIFSEFCEPKLYMLSKSYHLHA